MNLLQNIKIWRKTGSGSTLHAGTVGLQGWCGSTFIDMSNWTGCMFLFVHGSTGCKSSGTVYLQQTSGVSTGGGWGSSFPIILGTSHRVMALDVVKPLRRYLRVNTLTATGIQVIPITYNGRAVGTTENFAYIGRGSSAVQSRVVVCTSAGAV